MSKWDVNCTVRAKWISVIIPAIAVIFASISLLFFINKDLLSGLSGLVKHNITFGQALTGNFDHLQLCLSILESEADNKSHSATDSPQCSWTNLNETLLDALSVLKAVHIAFVGDSRIRDIFSQLKSLLTGEPFDTRAMHYNLDYESGAPRHVTLSFYWTPRSDENVAPLVREWLRNPDCAPQVVVFGLGAHQIAESGGKGLPKFIDSMRERAKEFKSLSRRSTVIWMPIHLMVVVPILHDHRIIAVGKHYSRKFAAVAEANGLPLWNAAYQMAASNLQFYRDNSHFDSSLLKMVTCQFLLAMNPHNC